VEQSAEGKSHQQTAGIQTMLRGFALIEFVAGKVRTVSQNSEQ